MIFFEFSFGFGFGCFVVLGYFCYVVLCDPIVLLIVFIVCLGRVSGVRSLLLRLFNLRGSSARQVLIMLFLYLCFCALELSPLHHACSSEILKSLNLSSITW